MRTLRVTLALALALGSALLGGSPASAGAWAVTVLDPLPDRLEPGRAYTVGFWVLQHGSHPYQGKLSPVGLRLQNDEHKVVKFFAGTPLPEPAHYAATILIPRSGSWKFHGVQGPFADYHAGTAHVPGPLVVLPVPPPLPFPDAARTWGEIRPPQLPVNPDRDPFDTAEIVGSAPASEPAAAVAPDRDDGGSLPFAAGSLLALVLVGVALAWGFRRWPERAALVVRRLPRREPGPRRDLVG